MGISPSRRMRQFLLWTLVTCMLLGVQKMMYEETPINLTSDVNKYFSKPKSQYDAPTMFPFHPFEENKPKLVIILTYQRSGSTFFGNIFNRNPDVLYTFEPLDSFYSAFYGTQLLWNVPSDITSYKNGSERLLPKKEIDAVSEFLSSLLSCRFHDLPAQTLLHPYIYYYGTTQFQGADEYIKCIEKYEQLSKQCASRWPRYCGDRFGEHAESHLEECHKALHDENFRKTFRKGKFEKYFLCMQSLKRIVDRKCTNLFQTKCENRPLRVTKTVRATMDSMETLLQEFPNFRIIHLVRDPRAVVLSRQNFDSSGKGLYTLRDTNNTIAREAKLLCRMVTRDVRLRIKLEKKYPGKIYPIVYDEMVRDLKVYVQKIYKFLDYPDPINSTWWKRTIQPIKVYDSVKRADQWQHVLTFEENKKVLTECQELITLINSPFWPV